VGDQSWALLAWALLALPWLARLRRLGSRRALDYAYPLLPLAVAAVAALRPESARGVTWIAVWASGLFIWAAVALLWLISLAKRDSSIMDIAYGLVLVSLPWWLVAHLDLPPSGHTLLTLALATLGFGRYSVYVIWRNLPHG
jgi:hypothetical protein